MKNQGESTILFYLIHSLNRTGTLNPKKKISDPDDEDQNLMFHI